MFRRSGYIIALLVFLILTLILASECFSDSHLAKIRYVSGDVLVKFPAKSWEKAYANMLINQNATVKTKNNAYCDIALDATNKNIASLGPNTQIILTKNLQGIEIISGRVFALLDALRSGSSFEVRTPVGSGGARGTRWETIVSYESIFNVVDDIVSVMGTDKSGNVTGSHKVAPGFSINIKKSGMLGSVVALSPEEMERLNKWAQKIKERSDFSSVYGAVDVFKRRNDEKQELFIRNVFEPEALKSHVDFPMSEIGSIINKESTRVSAETSGSDIPVETLVPDPLPGPGNDESTNEKNDDMILKAPDYDIKSRTLAEDSLNSTTGESGAKKMRGY